MGDGDVYFNITTENKVWQKADFTLKTSDAGGAIFFVGENGSGFAYIDNYELYVVQEPTVRIHYVDAEGNALKEDVIVEGNWTSLDPSQYLMIGHEYVASTADCASFEVNGVYYKFDDESSQDRVVLAEGENELTLTFKPYAVPVVLNETDESFQLQQSVYADVTVNREMNAGKWHSFCIPFDMTAAQLEENGIIEVQKLTGVTKDNNKVVLNFTEQDKIEGGIPYLIKVGSDIQSINVKGVYLYELFVSSKTFIFSANFLSLCFGYSISIIIVENNIIINNILNQLLSSSCFILFIFNNPLFIP